MKTLLLAAVSVANLCAVTVSSATSNLTVGDTVSFTYQAMGGTAPYTWHVFQGMLPKGLLLSSFGRVTGVLTDTGTSRFMLQATDASGAIGIGTFTFIVSPVPINQRISHDLGTQWALRLSQLAVLGVVLGDYETTEKCVHLPNNMCSEANPVLLAAGINPATAAGSKEFLMLKLLEPTIDVGLQELLIRRWHVPIKQMVLGNAYVAVIQGGVDWWNLRTTEKLEKLP